VTAGQIKNLLANVPPGSGKSLLVSVFWPAWEWTKAPAVRWFFASYSQPLATRDSIRCRHLVESQWYQDRWGVPLREDENQKTFFSTKAGGYRIATSVGGRGIGEHPDRIVADDPNKCQGVESDVQRESVVTWWSQTMASRGVVRDARRVVIQQRLHARDLSGYILANEPGEYVHVCLPMRYESGRMATTPIGWNDPRKTEGELLAPALFNEAAVAKLEKRLGSWGAAGQLQQRPAPRTGGFFDEAWFAEVVDFPPEGLRYVRYWDKAHLSGAGCWTCGTLVGTDGLKWYIVHEVRGQWSPHVRNAKILETAQADAALYGADVELWVEQEASGDAIDAMQIMASYLAEFAPNFEKPTRAKEVRAEGFAVQAEAGNVILVRNPRRPWESDNESQTPEQAHAAWKQEFGLFPRGAFMDRVDSASGAFRKSLEIGSFDRDSIARCFVDSDEEPLF